MKQRPQLSTLLTFGILFFLGINQLFPVLRWEQKAENRNLTEMPSPNLSKLDQFPPAFDAYLNDQLSFRPVFMDLYQQMKYALKVSSVPDKVIIGSDDYLFLGMRDQEVYLGARPYTDLALDSMKVEWKDRLAYFKEKKIPIFWFIPPIKQYVYEEKLPLLIQQNKPSRTEKLVEAMNKFYPNSTHFWLKNLLEAKKHDRMFFLLDNHWNFKAGEIAYLDLMQVLRTNGMEVRTLSKNAYTWKKERKTNGSLASFLGMESELSEEIAVPIFDFSELKELEKYGFACPPGFAYPYEFEKRYVNPKAKNKQRILIIRDSFGDALMPFIQASFQESMFVFDAWQYGMNKNIIEAYQPDIVLFLSVEAFTDRVLERKEVAPQ